MNPDKLKQLFPYASQSTIRRNQADNTARLPHSVVQDAGVKKSEMTIKPTTDEAKLNKTERAYMQYISLLGYVWIGVQNITLKLGNDTRFTPDFSTIDADGNLRFIDVKGFQREDALIKIKVAARLFPFAEFVIVKKNKSGWDHNYVKP